MFHVKRSRRAGRRRPAAAVPCMLALRALARVQADVGEIRSVLRRAWSGGAGHRRHPCQGHGGQRGGSALRPLGIVSRAGPTEIPTFRSARVLVLARGVGHGAPSLCAPPYGSPATWAVCFTWNEGNRRRSNDSRSVNRCGGSLSVMLLPRAHREVALQPPWLQVSRETRPAGSRIYRFGRCVSRYEGSLSALRRCSVGRLGQLVSAATRLRFHVKQCRTGSPRGASRVAL
jgi:hypothetical protein